MKKPAIVPVSVSVKVRIFQGFAAYQSHLPSGADTNVTETVSRILQEVRHRGDAALREYTQRFDQIALEQFRVPADIQQQALEQLQPQLREILLQAAENIRRFHLRQKTESQLQFQSDGTVLGWKVTPIDRVGIYIPGGRAVYPSTVLMNVIPAQVAQVPRIALVSPPSANGFPHPLILAASALLGIAEIYALGGAQSIAALAFGTESIPRVYKITGPGNAYVAEAKRQVYGIVGIDSFAGPSEILIICTREEIPVEYLVRDLLSQAEHDPDAGAILVTTSTVQAKAVAKRLEALIPTLPRHEIIAASFQRRSAIIVEPTLETIFAGVNEMAPEHLELLTAQPWEDLHKIRNAGAIFLGPHTPEPVGDYFAGPNHTLPTGGCAKFSSPLGVQDFIKTSSVLSYSPERLRQQGPAIMEFAKQEELFAHAAAIEARLQT